MVAAPPRPDVDALQVDTFDLDPDYDTWGKGELVAALKAHRRTLRGFYRTMHLPNTQMAPGEKLASIAGQCLLPQEEPDENGLIRYPTEDIATFIGMSESSTNRYANALIERFDATKVPVDYTTLKGQECKLTYVNRDEPVWREPWNTDLPEEKERVLNGNRRECPRCKTNNMKVTKRTTAYQEIWECDCCRYKKITSVINEPGPLEPMEYIPPKKGPQAGGPFGEDEPEPEDEEPITITASVEVANLNGHRAIFSLFDQVEQAKAFAESVTPPSEPEPEKKGPPAWGPFGEGAEAKAQKSEALTNPITATQAEKGLQPEKPFDDRAFLTAWLGKRIGEHIPGEKRIVKATGNLEDSKKYFYEEEDYTPDIARYLAGDPEHIYGSRMYGADGSTSVVTYDFDDKQPEHDRNHVEYMTRLAQTGIASLYFKRRPGRGHLEIHFTRPVDALAAHQWMSSIVPELAKVECFPIVGKQAVSWPLYQRIGNVVTECEIEAMSPADPGRFFGCKGVKSDPGRLAELVRRCVTKRVLVPARKVEETQPYAGGLLAKSLPRSAWEDDLIEAFNRSHSWNEIATMCGGWSSRGYFKAVWRGERTASVKPDGPDSPYACDYGNHGNFPKKLDKYGCYCLIMNIDPATDLKAQRAAMRKAVAA